MIRSCRSKRSEHADGQDPSEPPAATRPRSWPRPAIPGALPARSARRDGGVPGLAALALTRAVYLVGVAPGLGQAPRGARSLTRGWPGPISSSAPSTPPRQYDQASPGRQGHRCQPEEHRRASPRPPTTWPGCCPSTAATGTGAGSRPDRHELAPEDLNLSDTLLAARSALWLASSSRQPSRRLGAIDQALVGADSEPTFHAGDGVVGVLRASATRQGDVALEGMISRRGGESMGWWRWPRRSLRPFPARSRAASGGLTPAPRRRAANRSGMIDDSTARTVGRAEIL